MNWDALGSMAELLAAIGVIITLIYLARQLRMSNEQQRGAATAAAFHAANELIDTMNGDTELYKIALRGNEDFESLDDWEKQRFTLWALKETGTWEMYRFMVQQGALDPEFYQAKEEYWLQLHASPGRRQWLREHAFFLSKDFLEEVAAKIDALPERRLGETHALFDSRVHSPKDEG